MFDHCQWIYKTKYAIDGSVDMHKAHHVVKVFSEVKGIDYSETFFPVTKSVFLHGYFSQVNLHGEI